MPILAIYRALRTIALNEFADVIVSPSPDCLAPTQRGQAVLLLTASLYSPNVVKYEAQAFRRLEERKMSHAQVVCTIKYRQASAAKGNMGAPPPR
jgi:hypothetical protein